MGSTGSRLSRPWVTKMGYIRSETARFVSRTIDLRAFVSLSRRSRVVEDGDIFGYASELEST